MQSRWTENVARAVRQAKWLCRNIGDPNLRFTTHRDVHQSVDCTPWNHPYLQNANLRRMREFSSAIWDLALSHNTAHRDINIAFAVNIAQNAYKFGALAQEAGARVTLYLHPQDHHAISRPEWEEFDGEFRDILAGELFLERHAHLTQEVKVRTVVGSTEELGASSACYEFAEGDRRPLYRLLSEHPELRYEPCLRDETVFSYLGWARQLQDHDVVFAVASPIAAYLSGRPYCAHTIGGDLQLDCGRGDRFGAVMGLAFNSARFLTFTNPFTLSYCRRLGFTNAVYMPYPMDDHRYCPGEGAARREWNARLGEGIYVLSTARIDNSVKGNGEMIIRQLARVASQRAQVRFVFLSWGHHAKELQRRISRMGLNRQFIFLSPVGKRRLIDYYRSCDIVLDQFVYGYYGATGLEAAACGKPIVMRIRPEHYGPLYEGDIAPVENVLKHEDLIPALLRVIDDEAYRVQKGQRMREWLVRNHGRERTVPRMLGLLRMAADNVPLPTGLDNPLCDPESEEEAAYHRQCLQPRVRSILGSLRSRFFNRNAV